MNIAHTADPFQYELMAAALRYLEERAGAQPTLDEVAAAIGLSPTHFQKVFSQWVGVSPKRYLQYLTLDHARRLLDQRFTVLDAQWVMDHNADDILDVISKVVGDHPVYVTFDIDCLDPAFAPGTGTPAVGGLSTALALRILRGLAGFKLVGMDIVEVSPPYDHAEITALAAATLGLEFFYALAADKEKI